ncbi:translation initiation factor IF-2-like [Cuculus canorus]|uniref:translation initiation factor IF-2-like n=1 Tax=Cuculus canorus TaxID=55661 RepID=UPI0023AB0866|nr:translation initiation factor IF-2-like [Cuculus canorus]
MSRENKDGLRYGQRDQTQGRGTTTDPQEAAEASRPFTRSSVPKRRRGGTEGRGPSERSARGAAAALRHARPGQNGPRGSLPAAHPAAEAAEPLVGQRELLPPLQDALEEVAGEAAAALPAHGARERHPPRRTRRPRLASASPRRGHPGPGRSRLLLGAGRAPPLERAPPRGITGAAGRLPAPRPPCPVRAAALPAGSAGGGAAPCSGPGPGRRLRSPAEAPPALSSPRRVRQQRGRRLPRREPGSGAGARCTRPAGGAPGLGPQLPWAPAGGRAGRERAGAPRGTPGAVVLRHRGALGGVGGRDSISRGAARRPLPQGLSRSPGMVRVRRNHPVLTSPAWEAASGTPAWLTLLKAASSLALSSSRAGASMPSLSNPC